MFKPFIDRNRNQPRLLKENVSLSNLKLKPKKNNNSKSKNLLNSYRENQLTSFSETYSKKHSRNKSQLIVHHNIIKTLNHFSDKKTYDTGTLSLPLVTNILYRRNKVI